MKDGTNHRIHKVRSKIKVCQNDQLSRVQRTQLLGMPEHGGMFTTGNYMINSSSCENGKIFI